MRGMRRATGGAARRMALIGLAGLAACGDVKSPADDVSAPTSVFEAKVFFTDPPDDSAVSSPVDVRMDAERFDIEFAGRVADGSGHFHLMVDVGCLAPGETIPKDPSHLHFGSAQRRTELVLPPGEHNLCLQAGDGAHSALNLTDELKFTVTG